MTDSIILQLRLPISRQRGTETQCEDRITDQTQYSFEQQSEYIRDKCIHKTDVYQAHTQEGIKRISTGVFFRKQPSLEPSHRKIWQCRVIHGVRTYQEKGRH